MTITPLQQFIIAITIFAIQALVIPFYYPRIMLDYATPYLICTFLNGMVIGNALVRAYKQKTNSKTNNRIRTPKFPAAWTSKK